MAHDRDELGRPLLKRAARGGRAFGWHAALWLVAVSCSADSNQGVPGTWDGEGTCADRNGGCAQICDDAGGEVTCGCEEGFELASDGVNCLSKGGCGDDNGGCGDPAFTTCVEEGGGHACVDIDECLDDNGGCGDPAFIACVDNEGAAPDCVDIDECGDDNGGCGPESYVTCVNHEGQAATCVYPPLCDAILDHVPNATSGIHWIDPSRTGERPMEVYCDFPEGWTLVLTQEDGLFVDNVRAVWDAKTPQPGNTAVLSYFQMNDLQRIAQQMRVENDQGQEHVFELGDFHGPVVFWNSQGSLDTATPETGYIVTQGGFQFPRQVETMCPEPGCRIDGLFDSRSNLWHGFALIFDWRVGDHSSVDDKAHFGGTVEVEADGDWPNAHRGTKLWLRGSDGMESGMPQRPCVVEQHNTLNPGEMNTKTLGGTAVIWGPDAPSDIDDRADVLLEELERIRDLKGALGFNPYNRTERFHHCAHMYLTNTGPEYQAFGTGGVPPDSDGNAGGWAFAVPTMTEHGVDVPYVTHHIMHGWQSSQNLHAMGHGRGWIIEGGANLMANLLYPNALVDYHNTAGNFFFAPHTSVYAGGNSQLYKEHPEGYVVSPSEQGRHYSASAFLRFLFEDAGVSWSLWGDIHQHISHNRSGWEYMHGWLVRAGHDPAAIWLDFAARAATFDYGAKGDAWRTSTEASVAAEPNGFDYRYVGTHAQTTGGWVSPNDGYAPGPWGFNLARLQVASAGTFDIAVDGDDVGTLGTPSRLHARVVVESGGVPTYTDLVLVDNDGSVSVSASAGDTIYLAVAAAPDLYAVTAERFRYAYRMEAN